jgi:hypothetical protein
MAEEAPTPSSVRERSSSAAPSVETKSASCNTAEAVVGSPVAMRPAAARRSTPAPLPPAVALHTCRRKKKKTPGEKRESGAALRQLVASQSTARRRKPREVYAKLVSRPAPLCDRGQWRGCAVVDGHLPCPPTFHF